MYLQCGVQIVDRLVDLAGRQLSISERYIEAIDQENFPEHEARIDIADNRIQHGEFVYPLCFSNL